MNTYNELMFEQVYPAIEIKINEFKYFNCNEITAKNLWDYCLEKKWSNYLIENIHLYKIVATIMGLTLLEVINYNESKKYHTRKHSFFELTQDELDFLLNVKPPY